MKALVLAEKPSVAREIARVLNCQAKNKGYIEGPEYIVTWALGHLVTLCEPHEYDEKYKQWRLEDLPMLPEKMKLKTIKPTSHQYRVVKDLMGRKDVNELIIATDAGREGELVARWIIEKANCRKPAKRLWISSQTDGAIKEGFSRLKPGAEYNNLYAAAVCRAEADWLIGLNVTRALACKYNAQLTAGRVQTPTLAMIVNREKEIQVFKPVDYWTLRADFGDYFGDWRDKKGQGRIFDEARAREIAARLQGKTGLISELKISSKSEAPPLAYDLTELQRDANRSLDFSAQKTLSVLQDLYERHKLVSYPRTDSRYISSDIVPTLPARLKAMGVGPYAEFARALLQKKLNPGKRLVDNSKVSDHHAIIPTEQPLNLAALSAEEKKLYDLIARRFLAVLYPPHIYEQVTLITVVNEEEFHSRGKRTMDLGWKAVTRVIAEKNETDAEEIPEQNLTAQQKGARKELKSVRINKAKTAPPPRFTEASLLTAMESPGKYIEDEELRETIKGRGLGTPATRAEIIEKLVNSFYIERHGKTLIPTDKGIQLIALAPDSLRSPEMTAEWEQRLNNIASGKGSSSEFIAGIRHSTLEMVQKVIADDASYKATNVSRSKCPACGKNMLLVNGKKGKMLVCPDRNCGHRQPEKNEDTDIFKKGRGASHYEQKLIAQYSDKEEIRTNLSDAFKEALAKKENKSKDKK
ncbi:MAG TPA: DNA topoisomerase III [Syntrophomonadaceae bacterium]|nr:DNA topoisomerase III [Syntrophomonadaceae bacterium]HPR92694.1 DNA topoisomerase III [Syntrophomonadaceae bacterium]